MGSRSAPDARVLAIVGPTAVGKSALAHAAARALGGEIVVADPFQRYRGLEIAADSPRAAERAEVPYHLVGDLSPAEASSAGEFARRAHSAVDDILGRGRVAVVSGGSGLYLRAALADLGFPEPPTPAIREAAERLVRDDPVAALDRLRTLQPGAAARVDAANPRRLAQALAHALSGAEPPPSDALWADRTRVPALLVGLVRPRATLSALIAQRVEREIAEGLVDELSAALDAGMSREAAQIIGAREVRALRAGLIAAGELPDLLARRTRRLARMQLTWIRKTAGVSELDLGDGPALDALPALLERWRAATRAV